MVPDRLYESSPFLGFADSLECIELRNFRWRERGARPQGTIAYEIEIESSDPGARVEVNGDTLGKTPLKLKVFGDRDGTFHNFGSRDYVVKCYPVQPSQRVQSKAFRTGGWFSQ